MKKQNEKDQTLVKNTKVVQKEKGLNNVKK